MELMNDRLKELYNLSHDLVPHERDWDANYLRFNPKKFAEYIVNECIATIIQYDYDDCVSPNAAMLEAADDLRAVFDIKKVVE